MLSLAVPRCHLFLRHLWDCCIFLAVSCWMQVDRWDWPMWLSWYHLFGRKSQFHTLMSLVASIRIRTQIYSSCRSQAGSRLREFLCSLPICSTVFAKRARLQLHLYHFAAAPFLYTLLQSLVLVLMLFILILMLESVSILVLVLAFGFLKAFYNTSHLIWGHSLQQTTPSVYLLAVKNLK